MPDPTGTQFSGDAHRSHAARPDLEAFLSLGFRPLYIAGCAWALVSIAIWVFAPQWLTGQLTGVAWHAHEMLWGFVVTIAVGFLLTASATWTGHNPIQGRPLGWLLVLWMVARAGYLASSQWMFYLAIAAETLFFLVAAHSVMKVVLKGPNRRNDGLPYLVAGLGVINLLFLLAAWQGDYVALMERFNLGLICMAVIALLIGRRVIPFFANRRVDGLNLPMLTRSGQVQIGLGVLAILSGLTGQYVLMGGILGMVGLMGLFQLYRWKPWAVRHNPMLWILYLGYACLSAGLVVAAMHFLGLLAVTLDRPATFVHLIGMGGFGLLIIGMVTRTALGHLGRPLALDTSMLVSYVLVIVSVICRLWALFPSAMSVFALQASAITWILAMGLYLWRFTPMLIRPRAD